jgi:hypothetical protein
MNTYKLRVDVEIEVQAFNQEDASEYVHDIFNIDDEIKSAKIIKIIQK